MIVSTINYSQNVGKADEWHLKNVSLGKMNLIVSKNGVGKTMTVNIINSLARIISSRLPRLLNGNWDVAFKDREGILRYLLQIEDAKVVRERLIKNRKVLIERNSSEGEIVFFEKGRLNKKKFYPPEDKLTLQVRRDRVELPYLEGLIKWAENVHSFSFSNVRPQNLFGRLSPPTGRSGPELFPEDLGMAPYLLEEIQNDQGTMGQIIEDLACMGYKLKNLGAISHVIPGLPGEVRIVQVKEDGIDFPLSQLVLSSGMFRAIAAVVTINKLVGNSAEGTIIVDDIGEGLDNERSTKLAEIIFRRVKNTDIQLVLTTNDRFLMNAVDIKYWNVFERKGNSVYAFNYANQKKAFDDFKLIGLNNFDFFTSELYRSGHKKGTHD